MADTPLVITIAREQVRIVDFPQRDFAITL
jgi:hypothetical protein